MSTLVGTTPGGFRSAFLINLASAAGGNLLRFGVSLLLARLLMPAELGLVAIALAIVGVAQVLRDLGVSAFLQREPELSQERFGSCLGLLGGSTLLLSLLLFAGSGPLARHFDQPALQSLLLVLLLGFVLTPFSQVMAALMQRDLAAARIAYVSRLGGLAHAVAAVGLAALGCGAMSLAWAYVINVVVCGCAYWPLRPAGLAWHPSRRGWRPLLRFGLGSLLNSGLGGLNNALPDLLLGHMGSTRQVGLLGRANAAVSLFNALAGTAVNFGALRTLAELHHRQAALAPLLQQATTLLTGVGWPVLALIALFHEELVLLLYGRTWLDSAAAIPPLAAAAGLGLLFNYGGVALAAIGRPHLAAVPVATSLLARLVLAGLFFDGRLVSFAWVLLGAALMALPPQLLLLIGCLGQSLGSVLAGAWRSLLPCLAVLGVAALLRDAVFLALVAAAAAWLLALRLTGHELLGELHQLLLRLRSTIRK
ncbi:MAG TPA: oligosaccharide flippase family protein [Roseateles sp.]|nr:oligosaccharide flippase family protein [Roseateles sp.]